MLASNAHKPDEVDAAPDTVARLQAHLREALLPRLPRDERFALIDYPNHENVGDAAIWAGERAFLAAHGREVVYVSDLESYSASRLRRALGSQGAILLHGGGNFGDLYPHHQRHRESVITAFPDHPIVQLPQTATFSGKASIRRVSDLYRRHQNLTLLLRDASSLEMVRENFTNPSFLAPDSALALSPPRTRTCADGILWLARTDTEGSAERSKIRAITADARHSSAVTVTDWVGKRSAKPSLVAWREAVLLAGYGYARLPGRSEAFDRWTARSYDSLAVRRVAAGCRTFAGARAVVTDRLHGHILALLLGIPHVLLNDRHDKVGRFYRTWSHVDPHVKIAATPSEALDKAFALAGGEGLA